MGQLIMGFLVSGSPLSVALYFVLTLAAVDLASTAASSSAISSHSKPPPATSEVSPVISPWCRSSVAEVFAFEDDEALVCIGATTGAVSFFSTSLLDGGPSSDAVSFFSTSLLDGGPSCP